MTVHTAPDVEAVRDAVEGVPDPELPPVTIGMLGMVHDLSVAADGSVTVELLPTFSGCPATEMIERDVRSALARVPGVGDVTVRFRFDPPWSPARISATGHDRLREWGIAPPTGAGPVSDVTPGGRRALPVVGRPVPADEAARPCPYCGSDRTVRESAFGPTPCRDLRFCDTCSQPFEAFKHL